MSWKRMICTMIALMWTCAAVFVCAFVPVHASAEARNIYIGDIITLEISAQKIPEEELRQKFQDFEIIELKKESGRYLLSIRTFKPGEYTIIVGDKELVINVGSALTDIQRDDVFEAEAEVLEPGFPFHWRILLCVAAGVFVISTGFIIVKAIRNRTAKPESPYQLFLRRSSGLSDEDDNFFVDLTLFFKEYVESISNCRIIGKTSSEIADELSAGHIVADALPDIRKWLTECDVYKFTGVAVSDDEKHHHYEQLLSIVWRIEEKYVEIKEGAV